MIYEFIYIRENDDELKNEHIGTMLLENWVEVALRPYKELIEETGMPVLITVLLKDGVASITSVKHNTLSPDDFKKIDNAIKGIK